MLCCAVSQLAMRAVSQASYAVRGLAAMLCGLAELQRYVYEQLCSSQRQSQQQGLYLLVPYSR